ncbi:hypothetical protein [Terriglobus tenax]|uniref:hypothetical protein n=1 Tax=Terriglobus tenax TaxID=1111115 RepID=UPI0021E04E0C|nr:hypothetical protein [Terriglobus tenax]
MLLRRWLLPAVLCFVPASACLAQEGLRDTTLLIIRHAEKPLVGDHLTPAGEARAQHYATYFAPFTDPDGQKLSIDTIFAATDSKNSLRPRLTVEPLSKALGKPIDTHYIEKKNDDFVSELTAKPHGHVVLISWRHGGIPELLTKLGANPKQLLNGDHWPDEVFDWVIELHYAPNGKLTSQRLIHEPF